MNNDTFDLVHWSVMDYSMTDDERKLEGLRITCDKVLPPIDFLFRIWDKPCFPRGELVAVTGKAKSGKTLFNSMLMGGSLSPDPSPKREGRCSSSSREGGSGYSVPYLQRAREEPLRVLWYDTEQSEQSTQDILKNRILRLAASPSDPAKREGTGSWAAFNVFNVRCINYEERLRLFEMAVSKYRPDLVVLDGVRDLMADINDGVKAQEVVERLMRLAQETGCCLVCVLHQNKGAEDRNLRGWIGTELMNKAFEVYACEKLKPENIFVVEQTHTRKYDLDALLFFRMDAATELPVACEAPVRYSSMNGNAPAVTAGNRLPHMNREYLIFDDDNRPHPKTEELFYEALKLGPMYYMDLQSRVQELLNCGTPMWNNMFREMRDSGFIVRRTNKEGKAIWQLTASPDVKAAPKEEQPDLFDQIAADIEAESLSP